MVIENVTSIAVNLTDLLGEPVVRSLDFFIKVGIGASIAIIVYIIYLIVKGIFRARTASHVKQMLGVLKEINSKLDVLVKGVKKKGKK